MRGAFNDTDHTSGIYSACPAQGAMLGVGMGQVSLDGVGWMYILIPPVV